MVLPSIVGPLDHEKEVHIFLIDRVFFKLLMFELRVQIKTS